MNRKLDRVTSKLRERWLSFPASSEFEDLRLRFLNDELQIYLSSVQVVRRELLTFVLSRYLDPGPNGSSDYCNWESETFG